MCVLATSFKIESLLKNGDDILTNYTLIDVRYRVNSSSFICCDVNSVKSCMIPFTKAIQEIWKYCGIFRHENIIYCTSTMRAVF